MSIGEDRVVANGPALSRRALLRLATVGVATLGAAGAMVHRAGVGSAVDEASRLSQAVRTEIRAIARRIRRGQVIRLRDGTVIVDDWYLPSDFVIRINELSRSQAED